MSRFVNIVTGHNNLNYMLSLCFEEETPGCNFCNTDDETFYHYATECPALRLERENVFLDKPPCNNMEWSIKDLIKFSKHPSINQRLDNGTIDRFDDL